MDSGSVIGGNHTFEFKINPQLKLSNFESAIRAVGSGAKATKKPSVANSSAKGKNKIVPVDKTNFETFHAIKRDVEDFEAKQYQKQYWFEVS